MKRNHTKGQLDARLAHHRSTESKVRIGAPCKCARRVWPLASRREAQLWHAPLPKRTLLAVLLVAVLGGCGFLKEPVAHVPAWLEGDWTGDWVNDEGTRNHRVDLRIVEVPDPTRTIEVARAALHLRMGDLFGEGRPPIESRFVSTAPHDTDKHAYADLEVSTDDARVFTFENPFYSESRPAAATDTLLFEVGGGVLSGALGAYETVEGSWSRSAITLRAKSSVAGASGEVTLRRRANEMDAEASPLPLQGAWDAFLKDALERAAFFEPDARFVSARFYQLEQDGTIDNRLDTRERLARALYASPSGSFPLGFDLTTGAELTRDHISASACFSCKARRNPVT